MTDPQHCPTCGQLVSIGPDPEPLPCGEIWPPSLHDVTPVRCRLPENHRSEDHWHPALWPGTADLLWSETITRCTGCGYYHPSHSWCPRCSVMAIDDEARAW